MPWGIDDILLLAASTTALLYAKRGDVVSTSVQTAVNALTHDRTLADEVAARATANMRWSPLMLMKGFDLQSEYRNLLDTELRKRDARGMSSESTSNLIAGALDLEDEPVNSDVDGELSSSTTGLIKSSAVEAFQEHPVLYQPPNLPHRHYNPNSRIPHISALLTMDEIGVSEEISKYSINEIRSLFVKMERERLWEPVLRISKGIAMADKALVFLSSANVESALRALLGCAQQDVAVAYFFTYGRDILPSDETVALLFDACRYVQQASMDLYEALLPFKAQWTPTIYACCLTTAARFDHEAAFALYDEYLELRRRAVKRKNSKLYQALASAPLLQHSASLLVPDEEPYKLQYLYHIIIPLIVQHYPEKAERYMNDMLENDRESVPDVLLRCLFYEKGQQLAARHLSMVIEGGSGCFSSTQVLQMGVALYKQSPSAMNMNSLLVLMMHFAKDTSSSTVNPNGNATKHREYAAAVHNGKMNRPPSLSAISNDVVASLFRSLPLHTETDAVVLARTLSEHRNAASTWQLATLFLQTMAQRRKYRVIPLLASHLHHRCGQSATAAKYMALFIGNSRGALSPAHVSLSVEASVACGRWSSALFWVERAHAGGVALSPAAYDAVFAISSRCTWTASLRALTSMHKAGGKCSADSKLRVIEASANQGHAEMAFSVLGASSGLRWTQ